ncbi:MAG: type II toxin-antitoxin system VapC family toxin [Chloroflexota bacterium]
MTTLVVDASAYLPMILLGKVPESLSQFELVGPPLLWSETVSSLREGVWRGAIDPQLAAAALLRITSLGVVEKAPSELLAEAYRLAGRLGWAKTYDVEYVALATLLSAQLLTRDARLRRGAVRLVTFFDPERAPPTTGPEDEAAQPSDDG